MIESGIVNKVEEDVAWVTMVKGDQCAGCNACKAFGERSVELMVLNEPGAKPGDRVEVEIEPEQVVKHSIIVFLLPVLNLIVGYFLGITYLTRLGFSTQSAGIIGSLGLMIITFVGIIGYDRLISKSQRINARINRIL